MDIQRGMKNHRPRATFSSFRPMVRLDYIFASRHFAPLQITVLRNDLTRVASDHLPLVADLRVAPAAVGTSTMRPENQQRIPSHHNQPRDREFVALIAEGDGHRRAQEVQRQTAEEIRAQRHTDQRQHVVDRGKGRPR